jgi:hypothetical protein
VRTGIYTVCNTLGSGIGTTRMNEQSSTWIRDTHDWAIQYNYSYYNALQYPCTWFNIIAVWNGIVTRPHLFLKKIIVTQAITFFFQTCMKTLVDNDTRTHSYFNKIRLQSKKNELHRTVCKRILLTAIYLNQLHDESCNTNNTYSQVNLHDCYYKVQYCHVMSHIL